MRYFEAIAPPQPKPEEPVMRFFFCEVKDRGANAHTVEAAMEDLKCMACDQRMSCKGPEVN
jgi:hypothetical protein